MDDDRAQQSITVTFISIDEREVCLILCAFHPSDRERRNIGKRKGGDGEG